MESTESETVRKRKKEAMEESKTEFRDKANNEFTEEETEMNFSGSEDMELGIACIFEKVDRFNHLVSELLESGKSLFSRLTNEFEERVLMIHKEQIEKWQEEIKELRLLDATNEEMNTRLVNAKCLLQNINASH
ncbi:hypothetical protein Nepgr_013317 [Nepenthes gracilis]|uniref:Uncharacterized protein n=1 Tax=Nepenthes gracilis TaxID=150966 RepID=A0AAD3XP70_NEPGR|nr:hypothetical protein Nepgr_013317 [Nepenthes gracilis]